MSVTFPRQYAFLRQRMATASLLEAPVRALLSSADTTHDPWSDIAAIIDELDAIDAYDVASMHERQRREALELEVRARVVTPAPAGSRCTVARSDRRWNPKLGKADEVVVDHGAKVLVAGVPYCLTHAKARTATHVESEVRRLELERHAAGNFTQDEILIRERQAELARRREP